MYSAIFLPQGGFGGTLRASCEFVGTDVIKPSTSQPKRVYVTMYCTMARVHLCEQCDIVFATIARLCTHTGSRACSPAAQVFGNANSCAQQKNRNGT